MSVVREERSGNVRAWSSAPHFSLPSPLLADIDSGPFPLFLFIYCLSPALPPLCSSFSFLWHAHCDYCPVVTLPTCDLCLKSVCIWCTSLVSSGRCFFLHVLFWAFDLKLGFSCLVPLMMIGCVWLCNMHFFLFIPFFFFPILAAPNLKS